MSEAKGEIMYHFRSCVDFEGSKEIRKAKNKIFDFEVLKLVKC